MLGDETGVMRGSGGMCFDTFGCFIYIDSCLKIFLRLLLVECSCFCILVVFDHLFFPSILEGLLPTGNSSQVEVENSQSSTYLEDE